MNETFGCILNISKILRFKHFRHLQQLGLCSIHQLVILVLVVLATVPCKLVIFLFTHHPITRNVYSTDSCNIIIKCWKWTLIFNYFITAFNWRIFFIVSPCPNIWYINFYNFSSLIYCVRAFLAFTLMCRQHRLSLYCAFLHFKRKISWTSEIWILSN